MHIGKCSNVFSDLLKQLNIEDTEKNRKTKFMKCWFKITNYDIANYDIFSSINQINAATIEVKQDETPSWFNEDDALKRAKDAFQKWCDNHVFVDQEIDELSSGIYCLKNCKVECLSGDVEIEDCQDCQIECMSSKATLTDCVDSNINIMLNKASIEWCEDTQIGEMFDESSVFGLYFTDKSTIVKYAYENARINKSIKLEYDYRNNEES